MKQKTHQDNADTHSYEPAYPQMHSEVHERKTDVPSFSLLSQSPDPVYNDDDSQFGYKQVDLYNQEGITRHTAGFAPLISKGEKLSGTSRVTTHFYDLMDSHSVFDPVFEDASPAWASTQGLFTNPDKQGLSPKNAIIDNEPQNNHVYMLDPDEAQKSDKT